MRDLSRDTALLSLNTATVQKQWDLGEAISGCARHGIGAIAPWRDQLQALGVAEAVRMINDQGLRVSSLCRGGFFTADNQLNVDDNRRAVDEATALGAECLVLVVGGLLAGSRNLPEARRIVGDGIAKLLEHARVQGMRLAIEPLHPMYAADRGCINTLRDALDVCDDLGEGIGVAIDTYHVWWDADLERQIKRAGQSNRILACHVCDWLVPTQDLLTNRGMPGDGIIDLRRIRSMVEAAGYDGCYEIEIFSSKNWWQRNPDEVLQTCIERHQTVV